jgi:tetratricopeptide (TPR) repeat protein
VNTQLLYDISAQGTRGPQSLFRCAGKPLRLLGTVLALSMMVLLGLTRSQAQGIATPMASTPMGTPVPVRSGVVIRVTILDENKKPLKQQSLLYYRRGDYAHAAEQEEIVVASSGDSLIARKVLANSYLKLNQFDKAREHAQWMVDHGGSEGASARLVLGQALAGLDKREEAIQVLTAYVNGDPGSSVAPEIRKLISELAKESSGVKSSAGFGDPELAADEASAGNAGIPSDVDTQQPSVVAGVQCPANLLDETGTRSKELIGSISQFAAIEHIVHENISAQGIPRNRQTRQFNYIASISESEKGLLLIQEYRDAGNLEMPDKITTTGLPALAIAFHPLFRDDFEMRCEGLGEWQGQAAWLVHFRQSDARPSRLRSYVVNKVGYPVNLKGRAWIRADNFRSLIWKPIW